MTTRRILLGSLLALTFAACSGTATAVPTPIASTTPISTPAASTGTGAGAGSSASVDPNGLTGFCATFASDIQAAWPNIDAATAGRIAPQFQTWAAGTDFTTVKADMTTIVAWLTLQATAGAVASPPADVATAFDHIKTFATSHC